MNKKLLFTACTWLLCLGHAFADELVINDVTVPQGGTADLVVGYKFTTSTDKVGFTFSLGLPEGIALETDNDGEPVYVKDETSIAKLNIICAGDGNIGGQPSNDKATIKGTEGTLLTLKLKADASLTVGSTHTVNVTKATFQQRVDGSVTDINLDDFSFTVTIGEPADSHVVLDETSTTVPTAATGVDVRVKRTIKANEWSTICLPFAMTEAQVKAAFGDDVEIAEFTGWESTDWDDNDNATAISVTFSGVDAIEANTPYIIKVTTAVSEFLVDGVTIDADEEPCVTVGKKSKGTLGTFTGSYVPTTIEEECLFLNNNKFWYSTGLTNMKGYRAYFYFQDVLASYSAPANARITMSFSGSSVSSIADRNYDNYDNFSSDKTFDLQGRRVDASLTKSGLYIRNGQKVIVK